MSVYNGERFLEEAIDSILGQSFENLEFVIVDDGSYDRSSEMLEAYRKQDRRVKIVRQKNRGLIESLNRGCELAQGKYVARMDADDVSIKDRLKWQIAFMEEHPIVGVLGGAVEFIDTEGKVLDDCILPASDQAVRRALMRNCVIVHPTVLMRRDVVISVGGYRKCVVDAEDYDLWLRVAERSQLANLERIVLKRRRHAQQISVSKRRQQVFSMLAAQEAAYSRKRGIGDPLDGVELVTEDTVALLNVSEATKSAALARSALGQMKSMESTGEYVEAYKIYDEVERSEGWKGVEGWVVAESRLFQARRLWREGECVRGFLGAGCAIAGRPSLVGRPVGQLVRGIARWFGCSRLGRRRTAAAACQVVNGNA
jgi:hypothetical protein